MGIIVLARERRRNLLRLNYEGLAPATEPGAVDLGIIKDPYCINSDSFPIPHNLELSLTPTPEKTPRAPEPITFRLRDGRSTWIPDGEYRMRARLLTGGAINSLGAAADPAECVPLGSSEGWISWGGMDSFKGQDGASIPAVRMAGIAMAVGVQVTGDLVAPMSGAVGILADFDPLGGPFRVSFVRAGVIADFHTITIVGAAESAFNTFVYAGEVFHLKIEALGPAATLCNLDVRISR